MDELELVKQKTNIVELIQEYLPLKKAGVNFKTNCPFHHENTPSFVVSPERGIWHCFGCDKGGDVFKFIMEKEGMEFKEALEFLATKAGVVLSNKKEKTDKNEKLFSINQKAQQLFAYLLLEHKLGKKALDYLKKRGLSDETIKLFGIGYAPQSWDTASKFLKKRGFSTADQILSGICVESKSGCYDRFRGRIIFPLIDVRGRIIGFSGRILDKGEPKYINTPQTPIFDKGKFLFGIHLAKGEIKEKDEAIICEGEMDMIMSYQSGVKNIIASKGTALTEDQVESLKRYTQTISLCFDMDFAGDAASRRGIEIADKMGLNIKIIESKEAKDPAEVALKNPKDWMKSVENATPIYDYYLNSVTKRFDVKLASSKRAILLELLPIWDKIFDPITKEHYIEKLAALLQVKDDFIRKELDNFKLNINQNVAKVVVNTAPVRKTDKLTQKDRQNLLEEYLIALILHIPSDHVFVPNFPETLFTREDLKQIYVLLVLFLDSISFKGQSFKISGFVKDLSKELIEVVDRLYLMQIDEKLNTGKVWQRELETVISELKKILIKSSLEKLSLQIKSAQEFDKMESLEGLNRKFRDLSLKLRNL